MPSLERFLADETATVRLGEDIAAAVVPGDVVALVGDLGAGKTTLARALIRAVLADPGIDVPSPTFTLVQSYDGDLPVHHFDLYRLSSPDELDELGLGEALAAGVVLVEWPERAGDRLPADALTVTLSGDGDGRRASIGGSQGAIRRVERALLGRDLLQKAGWGDAARVHLAGDASARSYETVWRPGEPSRVLMNSPPLVLGPPVRNGKAYAEIARSARSVHAFVGMANLLAAGGVRVPSIHAADLDNGLLLIEDLGSGSFLGDAGEPVAGRYAAAAGLLAAIHARPWPGRGAVAPGIEHVIPPFDRAAMMIETELLLDWYYPAMRGGPADAAVRREFALVWNAAFDRLAGGEDSLVLRDFHSPNIIWRAEETGDERLGIIDFQDALVGPSAYDLASLALDARVTIPPDIERATVAAYATERRRLGAFEAEAFAEAYAIMAAQRNSKILGIFVRLDRRDGKPGYLKHLPRIRDYLRRALVHPSLAAVRDFYARAGLLEETAP